MPFGIIAQNNITMDNITKIINVTTGNPVEFFIRVNYYVYGGWFMFVVLWVLGVILYRRAQDKEDQPLINMMNVSSVLTVLAFFLRVINLVIDGIPMGLLTDFQMWMFPLLTVFLAGIIRYMAD